MPQTRPLRKSIQRARCVSSWLPLRECPLPVTGPTPILRTFQSTGRLRNENHKIATKIIRRLIHTAMTKKIWMYWHQGWETAPKIVHQCKDSWIAKNPDYEILALDQHSIFHYANFAPEIDFSRKDLTLQKISALGRLALLSQHGGIWADATVICARPLH